MPPHYWYRKNCGRFEQVIDAAAGRPSGRRPFIAKWGMGASAPIITIENFQMLNNKNFEKILM